MSEAISKTFKEARKIVIKIGSTNSFGTGGIETKIQAAEKTTVYGIPLLLANGSTPDIIDGLLNGSAKGTLFLAQ